MSLHRQHCLNHPEREAVARCPECGHFHCRECITEHDDRVICAACLKKLFQPSEKGPRRPLAVLARAAGFASGLAVSWVAFYWVGRLLIKIPASFHDGTLWKTGFWEE